MLPLQHGSLWRTLSVVFLIVVLMAAVSPAFWFSSKVQALSWFQNVDKWLHGITFLALAVWFGGLFERRRYWVIALGLTAFGLLLELCQLFIAYRMADWLDILANTAGILVGLAVAAAGLGGWGLRVEDWYVRRHPN